MERVWNASPRPELYRHGKGQFGFLNCEGSILSASLSEHRYDAHYFARHTPRKHKENNEMNWDQIEGKWKQVRGQAKEQWGKLTDDDLDVAAGNRDQLVGKVQEKYGIAKEEAQRQVDAWTPRT